MNGAVMNERKVMTVPEVAKALGVSRNTIYRAAERNEIPTIRIGKKLLVPLVAFNRMLELCGVPERAVE